MQELRDFAGPKRGRPVRVPQQAADADKPQPLCDKAEADKEGRVAQFGVAELLSIPALLLGSALLALLCQDQRD